MQCRSGRENLNEKLRFDPSNVLNNPQVWSPADQCYNIEEDIENEEPHAPSNPYFDGTRKGPPFEERAGQEPMERNDGEETDDEDAPRSVPAR